MKIPRCRALCAARLLAAGLAGLAGGGCAPGSEGAPGARSLAFVVLDTVRADHLPTYGYPRETAPAIDRLAQGAVVFENAFAQQTNTGPSHASMFTGLYPADHGARFNGQPLPDNRLTLAEILADAGFATGAFVSASTLRPASAGLEHGFDVYDDAFAGWRRDGRETLARALAWLGERRGERFFLFLHLYDAHGPYRAGVEHRHRFRSPDPGPVVPDIPPYQQLEDARGRPLDRLHQYVDRYDAAIRHVDDRVGELLRELDLEETLVVLLSDHGETLGERHHPFDHGGQVFDEQLRIPLVIGAPGIASRRVAAPVETVDLLPTVLSLLGLPPRADGPGRNLVGLLQGGPPPEERRLVYAEARSDSERHADRGYRLRPWTVVSALRGSRWKLILYPGVDQRYLELYDLARDPGERRDVSGAEPVVARTWLAALRERRKGEGQRPAPVPEPLRRQLEALGYAAPDPGEAP